MKWKRWSQIRRLRARDAQADRDEHAPAPGEVATLRAIAGFEARAPIAVTPKPARRRIYVRL